ncbi:MAG: GAF domain-containing sensor histidine kinase, partial [Promethearchaeota archaeon]
IIKRRIKLERLTNIISSNFLKSKNIDLMINKALKLMGRYTKSSRSFLFLIEKDFKIMHNTHEWCAPLVKSKKDEFQQFSTDKFFWCLEQLRMGKTIKIFNKRDIPFRDNSIKEFLKQRNSNSILIYPIKIDENLMGFIGLEKIKERENWTHKDFMLLNHCSNIIGNAILRENFSKKLEKEVAERTKKLNEALTQQQKYVEELSKASQFKTEFLTTMSHELRTPLNAIIGFTDLLLEEIYGSLTPEQLEFLKDIKSSAEYQFDMINNVLNISKIELGQVELKLKVINLYELVKQIVSSMKPLYEKKGLKFKIKGLKPNKKIIADPLKLKEILYNLISNAIKFTEKGTITFIFSEDIDNWIFSVKDTGIGITEKDFNIIFKDFKRVDSPIVNSTAGTGLGLSLTKRLVNLHGGIITFTSKLGKGSMFKFTIPKSQENYPITSKDFLDLL